MLNRYYIYSYMQKEYLCTSTHVINLFEPLCFVKLVYIHIVCRVLGYRYMLHNISYNVSIYE